MTAPFSLSCVLEANWSAAGAWLIGVEVSDDEGLEVVACPPDEVAAFFPLRVFFSGVKPERRSCSIVLTRASHQLTTAPAI
jgi:hypothetical protein